MWIVKRKKSNKKKKKGNSINSVYFFQDMTQGYRVKRPQLQTINLFHAQTSTAAGMFFHFSFFILPAE